MDEDKRIKNQKTHISQNTKNMSITDFTKKTKKNKKTTRTKLWMNQGTRER